MSEMYLVVLDDIRAAGLPKEQEDAAILGIKQFGRRIDTQPLAVQLQQAQQNPNKKREGLKEQLLKPSQQILDAVEKSPDVVAAKKQLADLRVSLGLPPE